MVVATVTEGEELLAGISHLGKSGAKVYTARMSEQQHRHCKCGAVYRRTESMAPRREMSSFECAVCGETMETWNTARVPTFKLIAGPVRPQSSARCSEHDLTRTTEALPNEPSLIEAQ